MSPPCLHCTVNAVLSTALGPLFLQPFCTALTVAARTLTRCCLSLMSQPPGPRAGTCGSPDVLRAPSVFAAFCQNCAPSHHFIHKSISKKVKHSVKFGNVTNVTLSHCDNSIFWPHSTFLSLFSKR